MAIFGFWRCAGISLFLARNICMEKFPNFDKLEVVAQQSELEAYKEYLKYFNKPFPVEDVVERVKAFVENSAWIEKFHDTNPTATFKLGVNVFSDKTTQEMDSMFMSEEYVKQDKKSFEQKLRERHKSFHASDVQFESNTMNTEQAYYVDNNGMRVYLNWASNQNTLHVPITGNIQNQGACGACWAFVTSTMVGAAVRYSLVSEPVHRQYTNIDSIPILSTQQLIDCDTTGNYGCNGGDPYAAMNYVIDYGLVSSASYPYAEAANVCLRKYNVSKYYVSKASRIMPYNEYSILEALQSGPVSVGVCGTDPLFLFYASGIFDDIESDDQNFRKQCCTMQNHALLIVGYGYDPMSGYDFWILQNSWGEYWGEKGFMKLRRNRPITMIPEMGICGILQNPSIGREGYVISKNGALDITYNANSEWRLWWLRWEHWVDFHWREVCLLTSVILIFSSFLMLGYGLYIDSCRRRRRGYTLLSEFPSRNRVPQKTNLEEQKEVMTVHTRPSQHHSNDRRVSLLEDSVYYQQGNGGI